MVKNKAAILYIHYCQQIQIRNETNSKLIDLKKKPWFVLFFRVVESHFYPKTG